MIELSEEPRRLVSTFLNYRNDIDIYTEDELKDKEFYKVLFKRLISSNITLTDITPLGSRSEVIEACKKEPANGRKKIFIIDGDINIVHGNNIPQLENLFVLDAYCIENYLFSEQSAIHFIYLNCGTKGKDVISKELNFQLWLSNYSEKLIELFIHYGIIDFFGGKFTLFNLFKFFTKSGNEKIFSIDLIESDIEKLKKEILKLTSQDKYSEKLSELNKKWIVGIESLITIVSGKDYLIPILLLKTQAFKKSKALPSLEEAKFTLVQDCNLDRLSKLKQAIESL